MKRRLTFEINATAPDPTWALTPSSEDICLYPCIIHDKIRVGDGESFDRAIDYLVDEIVIWALAEDRG